VPWSNWTPKAAETSSELMSEQTSSGPSLSACGAAEVAESSCSLDGDPAPPAPATPDAAAPLLFAASAVGTSAVGDPSSL